MACCSGVVLMVTAAAKQLLCLYNQKCFLKHSVEFRVPQQATLLLPQQPALLLLLLLPTLNPVLAAPRRVTPTSLLIFAPTSVSPPCT
jgi:hypothetical protein